MLSNSSKYAIKAVLFLAMNSDENKKIRAKHISESIDVPQAYLAKLLQELSRQNIVSATKGPRGGFFLDKQNLKQPLIKIVNVIDGKQRIKSCLLSLKSCDEKRPCPLHNIIAPSRQDLLKNLKEKTVQDISSDILNGTCFFPI